MDGSGGIYTSRTLSFSNNKRTGKSFTFDGINERQIFVTYINETISMRTITSIYMIILD